ncbi:hypothetical protein KL920_001184 [Ogataea angusta]|nr:hypothetical protein KL920_001184 [Ogataea angusta]
MKLNSSYEWTLNYRENGLKGDVDRLRSEVSLGQDCTFVLWSLILKHGVRTPGSRTVSAMPWYSYNVAMETDQQGVWRVLTFR